MKIKCSCPGLRSTTRREFLGASITGAVGLALSPVMQTLLAKEAPARRAKSCILLWLNGGPSHIDTWDPKPGAETGGPFKAIATKAPGMQISEHLPKLAQQAKHLAIIRSMTSREADHDRAYTFLHTGNIPSEVLEYPSLGSVLAREWAAEDSDLPAFVTLSGGSPSAGFFGVEYAPYAVGDLANPIGHLIPPEGIDDKRRERRLNALKSINNSFAQRVDRATVADHERFTAKALKLQKSPALKAFDLSGEKAPTLKAYGIVQPPADGQAPPADAMPDNPFGRVCLTARRLIEHGVRFVEVTLDGWDTHADNFNAVKALSDQLDPAFAALLGDLSDRKVLDQTLVLCMGEFGRTPVINGQTGRDHHSDAFSAVLAGGGIKGGQVIGASDAKGSQVKDRPVGVPDLYASLMAAFGIDPAKQYRTPEGRPIKLADKGKVVQELFR
jgi:uncharacterized protein (DUF1501 family)